MPALRSAPRKMTSPVESLPKPTFLPLKLARSLSPAAFSGFVIIACPPIIMPPKMVKSAPRAMNSSGAAVPKVPTSSLRALTAEHPSAVVANWNMLASIPSSAK